MNEKEISAEMMRDLGRLENTKDRLVHEYDKERRKHKIDRSSVYPKVYPVKTKAKNNWLIFMHKSLSQDKYRNCYDVALCNVVFYYDKYGLKAMRYIKETDLIEVFSGHLFKRYNERLQLNLSRPIDAVIRFFNTNGYLQHIMYEKNGTWKTMGICKEGITFGEFQNEEKWLVNKTFITKNMAFAKQIKIEKGLIEELEAEVMLGSMFENFNEAEYKMKKEVLSSIAG